MIFNIFRSKPTLGELIPNGFVDIHSHILPGIDDGAKNIEESLRLISEMQKLGFSKITATPHTYPGIYDNKKNDIKKSFESIKNYIPKNMEITYASEYLIETSLIKKIKNNSLLTIKNNYVLVEMSYLAGPLNLYEIIFELKVNGYLPVLAHPERYSFLFNRIDEYRKLKKFGCLFQLNLLSLTGYYGPHVTTASKKLLNMNYIDYVGSDIHSLKHIRAFKNKVLLNQNKKINELIERTNNTFI